MFLARRETRFHLREQRGQHRARIADDADIHRAIQSDRLGINVNMNHFLLRWLAPGWRASPTFEFADARADNQDDIRF